MIASVVLGSVLLGILGALAMPDLREAKQQSQQERTLASIRAVGTLVEAYGRDHKGYPRAESMEELRALLVPKYGRAIPLLDAWGNDLRYGCSDEQCKGYAITSSGADRMFEQFYTSRYSKGTTTNLDCDIVWADGTFLQYPAGTSP